MPLRHIWRTPSLLTYSSNSHFIHTRNTQESNQFLLRLPVWSSSCEVTRYLGFESGIHAIFNVVGNMLLKRFRTGSRQPCLSRAAFAIFGSIVFCSIFFAWGEYPSGHNTLDTVEHDNPYFVKLPYIRSDSKVMQTCFGWRLPSLQQNCSRFSRILLRNHEWS